MISFLDWLDMNRGKWWERILSFTLWCAFWVLLGFVLFGAVPLLGLLLEGKK